MRKYLSKSHKKKIGEAIKKLWQQKEFRKKAIKKRRKMRYNTKHNKILTKEFLIKEYIKNKKSTLKIAKKINCNYMTIIRKLEKYNIKIRTFSEARQLLDISGNNSFVWKGGKSFEPYPLGWNKTFKEQIRYRDGYRCQLCGKPEIECNRKLEVHHIDYNKMNIKPENLTSLCKSCHMRTNFNRNYWIEFFNKCIIQKNESCVV